MQEKDNNHNKLLLLFGFLTSFIIFIIFSISSSALTFDYDLNDQVFKDFRSRHSDYIIYEDTSNDRLYIYGAQELIQKPGDKYGVKGDYEFSYTKDGKKWNNIGFPSDLKINDSNIVLKDASKALKLSDGTVFFYLPASGIMGDVLQIQIFQNVKIILIVGLLALSLMLSPILLKKLYYFL